jgi:putative beta-lysine N-acetyltransferase
MDGIARVEERRAEGRGVEGVGAEGLGAEGQGRAAALVEDIKPVPVKQRAPLGVVELTLGEGQVVKAVGVVYGLEHAIRGPGFSATVFLDQYNQRLRILEYEAEDLEALILRCRWLAEANGFDKILFMAHRSDWRGFLRHGYVLEAVLAHYHRGEDAFVVSKFRSQERLTSHVLMEEILAIERLMAEPTGGPAGRQPLPEGYRVRAAQRDDIPALLTLYRGIFESYPSPLVYASYLETVFQKDSLYMVCEHAGRVVAAASAELHPGELAAELTDCATLPETRGLGLMSHLLVALEEELRRRRYVCGYTMARARSFGMNRVFHRLGYAFSGRLVNNCDIYGAYEDMNIWVKDLRTHGGA